MSGALPAVATEYQASDYLPLAVGNSWTYDHDYYDIKKRFGDYDQWPAYFAQESSEFTIEVLRTEELDGQTYYVISEMPSFWPPPPPHFIAGKKLRWEGTQLVEHSGSGEQAIFRFDGANRAGYDIPTVEGDNRVTVELSAEPVPMYTFHFHGNGEGGRGIGFLAGYGLDIGSWKISGEDHPLFINKVDPLHAVIGGTRVEYEDALIPTPADSTVTTPAEDGEDGTTPGTTTGSDTTTTPGTTGTDTPQHPCVSEGAVPNAASNPGLVSDCAALLEARDTLAGTASLNWSASTPIADWDGVTLGAAPQRVIQLRLQNKGLNGTIPASLGKLSKLEALFLTFNQLTGSIPADLGSLTDLWQLFLNDNQLTGAIPVELSELTRLTSLNLAGNQLSGCIPDGLGKVAINDLEKLNLPDCAHVGGRRGRADPPAAFGHGRAVAGGRVPARGRVRRRGHRSRSRAPGRPGRSG